MFTGSLRQLTEPVYVLRGVLTEPASGATFDLVVARDVVRRVPAEARVLLELLTVPAAEAEVLASFAVRGGDHGDLDLLVEAGLVVRLVPGDDAAVLDQLDDVAVVPAYDGPLRRAADGRDELVLASGRHVLLARETSAVVFGPGRGLRLPDAVVRAAQGSGASPDAVRLSVLSDLGWLLRGGLAFLGLPSGA